jgi:hypothetical protein
MHGIALGRSQPPVNLQAWYTDAMMAAHQEAMTIAVGGIVPDSTLGRSKLAQQQRAVKRSQNNGCARTSSFLYLALETNFSRSLLPRQFKDPCHSNFGAKTIK